MANRILRDWTQSENVNSISEKAEVFFTRLIMKSDDFGRFYGNVKLLRAGLYPLRNVPDKDIEKSISECLKAKLIVLYTIENKDFIEIINFGQRLRIMKSKFPPPNDRDLRTSDSSPPPETETKRNEDETESEIETEKKKEFCEKVFLTDIENEKLKQDFAEDYENALSILSNYKLSSGKKYKSDYHAIIGWVKDKINKEKSFAKKEKFS